MKKMIVVVTIVVGLAVSGFFVVRHHRRSVAPTLDVAQPIINAKQTRPMNTFQSAVKLEATDYTADPEVKRRLLEKLNREEQRQRPQEQRN